MARASEETAGRATGATASGSARPTHLSRFKAGLGEVRAALKETVVEWLEDGIPQRGAALSYYVLLSLGPLLVLLVAALEFFLTSEAARTGVVEAVRSNVGAQAASTTATVLERVTLPDLLAPESLLTIGLLLFGATAAFANVRGSLNTIWGVEPDAPSKREIAIDLLRARVRGFLMIVLTGAVIALSFAVTSATAFVLDAVPEPLRGRTLLVQAADWLVSFILTGLLFGAIYRTLPAARVEWSTVWVGAFATALFFVVGKALVAWLISTASWTSYYGPGASVVAFLAWIYFSSQLFFLGAEFTQVWSRRRGRSIADVTDG